MAKICYLYFILLLFVCVQNAQTNDLKFEHLTTQNGLSSNTVFDVIQDHQGIMWFGTLDGGLNRYDGYTFKVYKHIPGDSTSLPQNRVEVLFEDHEGQLWIGLKNGGLCRYNRDQDNFTRYYPRKNDPTSISTTGPQAIFEAKMNGQYVLWIGGSFGISRYFPETDSFKRYYPEENKEGLTTNVNVVYSFAQDSSGQLWVGMVNEGLFYYDEKTDRFIRFKAKAEYAKLFRNKYIYRLLATRENNKDILWVGVIDYFIYKIDLSSGEISHYLPTIDNQSFYHGSAYTIHPELGSGGKTLWIGTNWMGLYRFDNKSQQFTQYIHDPVNPASFGSNGVLEIIQDKSGILWIANWGAGICKVNELQPNFSAIKIGRGILNNTKIGEITSFCESHSERKSYLWIGTDTGIYKIEQKTGSRFHFTSNADNKYKLTSNHINTLLVSKHSPQKYVWAGTSNSLNRINIISNEVRQYLIPSDNVVHKRILSLTEDENGSIWIGTYGTYLYNFNPESEKFTLKNPPRGHIYTVHYDSYGYLWTGGGPGLEKVDLNTGKSTWYIPHPDDPNSLSNRTINIIFEDRDRNIWAGTPGGLNKFERSTQTFIRFMEKDGLASEVIKGILEDDSGNLWISTARGISRFNPDTKTFKNYEIGDGLHGSEFGYQSAYKSESGALYFGGTEGFTMFYPDSVKDNNHIPPIIISGFQIFNQNVKPRKNSALKKQITDTKSITLTHDQSVFSFEFAALDYHNPQKNQYAYQMEGVDPDWVYTDASRRFATYTNLDPGAYTFKVKGSNNDGVWNEQGTSVKIIILPPWWRTKLAYTVYVLLFIMTLYALRTYDRKRQRLKQDLEMEHFEVEKLREVDHMKSRFFANISHEFRTPLTLIEGPIKQLKNGEFQGNIKNTYDLILKNTHRLLDLINQLLDLSKLEARKLKIQVSRQNIIPLLNGLVQSFESLARRKNIDFIFNKSESKIEIYIDQEKFEKIIINLLSNAFKFTPERGKIIVTIAISNARQLTLKKFQSLSTKFQTNPQHIIPHSRFAEISITNSGSYLTPEQIDHIFDRFYTSKESIMDHLEGTGIGLALVKELVEIHHGHINVRSDPRSGTSFILTLPLGKDHFRAEEIAAIPEKKIISIPLTEQIIEKSDDVSKSATPRIPATQRILVVEDNQDVRSYISSLINSEYSILEAKNGEQALQISRQKNPDLIISDVMMPGMDGLEFCRQLKKDIEISHIPIILLTARADLDDKLEGLELGADDYIAKPFEAKELVMRVRNVLIQRENLRRRFSEEFSIKPREFVGTSVDDQFISKILNAIENEMHNPGFDVNKIAKILNVSRATLNRKIKALTGFSPAVLLKFLRLKKARKLLLQGFGNVAEVAFEVGFNSPSNFTRSFVRQFGHSPSEDLRLNNP